MGVRSIGKSCTVSNHLGRSFESLVSRFGRGRTCYNVLASGMREARRWNRIILQVAVTNRESHYVPILVHCE